MDTTEHNALQLAEKLEQLKKSESDLITERDYRDEIIDRTAAGKSLTKTAQVRMAGNSVSPLPMRLIVAANYTEAQAQRRAA